jgi:hypothetical protein
VIVQPARHDERLGQRISHSGGTESRLHRCWAGRWALEGDTMNTLAKTLIGAAMGAGMLALSSVGAFAAIVCQGNVCWHTHEAYDYPHEAGIVVHEDNWRWGPHEKFAFREHEGRGYWRQGKWVAW